MNLRSQEWTKKSEIKDFITSKETNGALLITGKWGCGKSYLMQNVAKELNARPGFAVVFISLFGIDSLSTLIKKVKESIFNIKARSHLSDLSKKKVSKAKNTIAMIASSLSDYSSIAKSVNAALTVNLYDLVEIERSIPFKQNGESVTKELILVFDDFERPQVNIIQRLGVRELARALLDLNFSEPLYSHLEDMHVTITNLNTLVEKLKQLNQNEIDQMTIGINNHFLNQIKEIINALVQKTEDAVNT